MQPATMTPTEAADRFGVPVEVRAGNDEIEIRDFTIKEKRAKFRVDDDVFEATAIMSIPMMQGMMQAARGIGDVMGTAEEDENSVASKLEKIYEIFDKILIPTSAKRFRERLEAEPASDDALDARRQVIPILYYLLEKYGLRPTTPSAESSDGSPSESSGTTSTPGSSTEVTA
jgi:hypothetical protein